MALMSDSGSDHVPG